MCIDLKDNMLKCESSNMQVPFLGEGDIPKRESTSYTRERHKHPRILQNTFPPYIYSFPPPLYYSSCIQRAQRAQAAEPRLGIYVAGHAMGVSGAGHARGVRVAGNSSLHTPAACVFSVTPRPGVQTALRRPDGYGRRRREGRCHGRGCRRGCRGRRCILGGTSRRRAGRR